MEYWEAKKIWGISQYQDWMVTSGRDLSSIWSEIPKSRLRENEFDIVRSDVSVIITTALSLTVLNITLVRSLICYDGCELGLSTLYWYWLALCCCCDSQSVSQSDTQVNVLLELLFSVFIVDLTGGGRWHADHRMSEKTLQISDLSKQFKTS